MDKILTMDQRADNYTDSVVLSPNTYKGDVSTAYTIGCMDQQRIERLAFETEKDAFIIKYCDWKHDLLLRGNLNFVKSLEDEKWFLNTEPTKKPGQQNWKKLSEQGLLDYYRAL